MKITLTTNGYNQKPSKRDFITMKFKKEDLTIDEIKNRIEEGYVFSHNSTESRIKNSNFESANYLWIDVDDSYISMLEALGALIEKKLPVPTFYYQTFNSKSFNRFRFVYFLNKSITNSYDYIKYESALLNMYSQNVELLKDTCSKSVAQIMIGTNKKCYYTGEFLDIKEIEKYICEDCIKKAERTITNKIQDCQLDIDKELLDDLYNNDMNDYQLLSKWQYNFDIIDRTEIDFNGEAFKELDDKYTQIDRRYEIVNGKKKIHIFQDGENRRKHFVAFMMLKKQIKNDVTANELLWNAVYERYHFFNNSDNAISNNYIIRVIKSVLNNDCNFKYENKHKIKVNKDYCQKNFISAQKVVGMWRRGNKDDEVLSVYDCSLSLRKNIAQMKELGISCSLNTLQRILKEHDLK